MVLNATDPIAVTLTAQEWEAVMRMLSDQPYKMVAPFIQSIQSQCVQSQMAGMKAEDVSDQDNR